MGDAQVNLSAGPRANNIAIGDRISRAPHAQKMPLSFAQEQIWLHSQLVPHIPIYNEVVTICREGTLDVAALEHSLTEIVRRHAAWRTNFPCVHGEPVQVVGPPAPVRLQVVDLRSMAESQREAEALRLAGEAAPRPFDLSTDVLFRALVVHLSDLDHRLFLVLHHIIFDGYSISRVLLPELAALYDAFSSIKKSNLSEPSIEYPDFALWQRDRFARHDGFPSQLDYWRKVLGADVPVLQLPADRARPPIQTYRGAAESIAIERALSQSLKRLGQNGEATLFMTLLAAFAILLQRYSSCSDPVIGTVSSGRNRVEVEHLLGCFVNSLALRLDLSGGPTFREVLRRSRRAVIEALSNDDVPFTSVMTELHSRRSLGTHPIFQILFTLEPAPLENLQGWNVSLTRPGVNAGTSRFDLSLELDDRPDGIVGRFRYSTDLFDRPTVIRLRDHLLTLLRSIVANPGQRISEFRMISPGEEQAIHSWNETGTEYPGDQALHELFARQAKSTPEATALVEGEQQLTYGELDRKTDALAAYLRGKGIGPEKAVGLYLEPSLEMIVGTLGVLKAGGTCVPLDPSYPEERFVHAVRDAQLGLLLTQGHLHSSLPQGDGSVPETLSLDADWDHIEKSSNGPVAWGGSPENRAYVIYTSGSTGKPKGVQVEHRNLVHSTHARLRYYGPRPATFLLLSSFSFDSSLAGIFGTLCQGGALVLTPGPLKANLTRLSRLIQEHRVTRLLAVPSLYALILEQAKSGELATLEEVILGGEACSPELVERHYKFLPGVTLYNEYGPTEATVWSTVHRCLPASTEKIVSIGKPIANVRAYVLDSSRNLLPVGVPGELYLGGAGVARGYLNRPLETERSFVPDPFSGDSKARLYRTGDVARQLPDGNLELLGRLDHQVKLRGFRIELEEIESAICEYSGVYQAATGIRQLETGGERVLVAYVVPRRQLKLDKEELRRFLCRKLPEAMLPARFVLLPDLPLMPNGKVDRHALAVIPLEPPATEIVPPEGAAESILLTIWQDVLRKSKIGVTDNFFELGGTSLQVAKLLLRVEGQFGKRLSLAEIFETPTIRQMACLLPHLADGQNHPAVVAMRPFGSKTPLFWVDASPMFLPLARSLDEDQPLLGLRVPLADAARLRAPFRIEDGARLLVQHLREVRPEGPYYLAGLCISALVAYEMARQLASQGQVVALLALFDVPDPPATRAVSSVTGAMQATKLEALWRELLRGGMRGVPGYLQRRSRAVARRLKLFRWGVQQSLGLTLNLNKLFNDPDAVEQPSSYHSKPRTYGGQVTFFQSDDWPTPSAAWDALISGGFQVHRVSGGHISMFQEENVAAVAGKLSACLSACQRREERAQ